MQCNARLYKEQLQLGKDVANNLQEYDDIPSLSLSTTHKQALELYKLYVQNTQYGDGVFKWVPKDRGPQ